MFISNIFRKITKRFWKYVMVSKETMNSYNYFACNIILFIVAKLIFTKQYYICINITNKWSNSVFYVSYLIFNNALRFV